MNQTRAEQANASRCRILDAARDGFAAEGYERVTIRAVAQAAGVDPALVMRYYGSKEKLFAAATSVDLGLPLIADMPWADQGAAIAGRFFDLWESPETGRPLRIMLTTAGSGIGRSRILAVFDSQLEPILSRHAGPSGRQVAAMVASQLLGFAFARYVLQLDPITTMDRQATTDWLGPTLQGYLDHPHPAPLDDTDDTPAP